MADIVLGAPNWLTAVLVACLILSLAAIWSYRRSWRDRPILVAGLVLKLLGIWLVGLCLLEPKIQRDKPQSQANIFALLADNSQSMLVGSGESVDRERQRLQEALDINTDWQRRIAQDFRTRLYRFDDRIAPVEDLSKQTFDGNASQLHSAIADLADRFPAAPVAGVLLFSDGNATDSLEKIDWNKVKFPIYPVTVRESSKSKDLRIESMTVRESTFETSPITVDVQLGGQGIVGSSAVVQLVDAEGQIVEKQTIAIQQDDRSSICQFRFRPKKPGVSGYRVQAFLESEFVTASQGTSLLEATLLNNSRQFTVDRGTGPYRILYVAGRPNWEHKFLRRAIEADDELRMVSLLRIARKEPKFNFRDTNVDSSNPLFSGFKDISEEEKEQFDQPVLVRLGVTDGEQLSKGFPVSAEELFDYQAIVLDDLESEFFTHDQLLLLRQFVTQRGGALMMLGGQETFSGRDFQDTPLGELMPIYVDESNDPNAKNKNETHQFALTREGWLEPFLRVKENEASERKRLAEMPPFAVLNSVRGVKPGASVLAEAATVDGEGAQPAFVTQRFGKGRTATLLIGDMWRWAMHEKTDSESPLFQAWRQTLRWIIADVPHRVDAKVIEDDQSLTNASQLEIAVLDERYEPLDNANVKLRVKMADGSAVEIEATASQNKPGVYTTNLMTKTAGVYVADVEARASDGSLVGSDQVGWVSDPAQREFQSLDPNRTALEEIAQRSGGRVLRLAELPSFVRDVPVTKSQIIETQQTPLWHSPWVIALAIGCFCIEWGLRRRGGLA